MSGDNGKLDARTETVEMQEAGPMPGAVAKALADHQESLGRALQVLSRMEREGTLDELADVLALVKLVKGALTDQMVISLARRIEGLAAVATDPVLTDLAGRLPAALRGAEAEAARSAEEPPGLMGLVRQLRDPQVRSGLTFFLSLAKHLAPAAAPAGKSDDAG